MNFDINMISNLMKMMNSNVSTNCNVDANINTDTRQSHSCNCANENNKNVSAFASENGIGEKVDFDGQHKVQNENKNANILSMLKGFAPNNPLLQMLGGIGGMSGGLNGNSNVSAGGNSNGSNIDISQMLPLLMSMMGTKDSSAKNNNCDNKTNGNIESKKENDFVVDKKNASQNEENFAQDSDYKDTKIKTQQALFQPVAFAGYEVLCTLCKLMLFCKSGS